MARIETKNDPFGPLRKYSEAWQEQDNTSNKNAVIYARVSSTGDRQDTERQVHDLRQYATGAGLDVVRVFEEKASGAKVDRPVLQECVEFLKGWGAQLLMVSELSRLGRSLRQVLEVVEDLTGRKVDIYFQDHRMHTLKEDGTPDPVTKMLISMLGSFAEMEREQIAYRLNSGRQRAIEKVVKMGRKEGYKLTDEEILPSIRKSPEDFGKGYPYVMLRPPVVLARQRSKK